MNTDDLLDLFDELDDNEQIDNFIDKDKRRKRFPDRHFKYVREANSEFLDGQDDSRRNFKFTYSAARFEEGWLLESLGDFYEHQLDHRCSAAPQGWEGSFGLSLPFGSGD